MPYYQLLFNYRKTLNMHPKNQKVEVSNFEYLGFEYLGFEYLGFEYLGFEFGFEYFANLLQISNKIIYY